MKTGGGGSGGSANPEEEGHVPFCVVATACRIRMCAAGGWAPGRRLWRRRGRGGPGDRPPAARKRKAPLRNPRQAGLRKGGRRKKRRLRRPLQQRPRGSLPTTTA